MSEKNLENVRTVFLGTPAFAVPSLHAVIDAGVPLVGVITRPDKPAGRGHVMQSSVVARAARERGLLVFTPPGLTRAEDQDMLRALQPELLIVVAYGHILPKAVLDLPRFGAVNVHASLLPQYRGPAPIPAAILAGDAETGITIMQLDEGVDTGPMLTQEHEPIRPEDTTASLSERLAEHGAQLLVQTLKPYLEGTLRATLQDHANATRAPMLRKEDGRIDWSLPAKHIERMTRAYTPWPHACTTWNDKRIVVHRASVRAEQRGELPGTVFRDRNTLGVVTGQDVLLIHELQLEGRERLSADAFLHGTSEIVGGVLG